MTHPRSSLVIEGRVTPEDKARSPFLYLPFAVPEGTGRIDVRYSYDPGNVIDLGALDPTIEPFPARRGFRGWSGGARSSFFVARDDATPGYIAGEIQPGEWRVMLGLYRIAPEGCAYRVEIELDGAPRPLVGPLPAPTAVRPGAGWVKGDLQSHTWHSDAKGSLDDLVRAAKARGLDFLAVTDHNTYGHYRDLARASSPELVLIRGQEVTTYRGHANVWGVEGWVDFRLLEDADLDTLVREVHARGGLISVNHPKRTGSDWEYRVPEGIDAMEAWQSTWPIRNWESLERYDALLREGRRVTLVGGSDRHQPGWPETDPEPLRVGTPATWVHVEDMSEASLLAALKSGRAFVTEGPAGPHLDMTLDGAPMGGGAKGGRPLAAEATVRGAAGDTLRWVGARGVVREVVLAGDDVVDRFDWTPDGPYLRAEIVARHDPDGYRAEIEEFRRQGKWPRWLPVEEVLAHPRRRALSNPVYVDP